MSFQKVFARMEEWMVEDAENYDGVLYWRGITIFEWQGHKLIVGNGFVWDAREEKLYGDPKNALGQFGGSDDCDEDVLVHYTAIRMATRQSDDNHALLKNELWELQLNDGGFVDVMSTDWNQIIAEVTPWGYVNLYITKEQFLSIPAGDVEQTEREKLLRKLDDLGYTEDEVRLILGV